MISVDWIGSDNWLSVHSHPDRLFFTVPIVKSYATHTADDQLDTPDLVTRLQRIRRIESYIVNEKYRGILSRGLLPILLGR